MVCLCSEKPIFTPLCLAEMSPVLSLKQAQCSSEWHWLFLIRLSAWMWLMMWKWCVFVLWKKSTACGIDNPVLYNKYIEAFYTWTCFCFQDFIDLFLLFFDGCVLKVVGAIAPRRKCCMWRTWRTSWWRTSQTSGSWARLTSLESSTAQERYDVLCRPRDPSSDPPCSFDGGFRLKYSISLSWFSPFVPFIS